MDEGRCEKKMDRNVRDLLHLIDFILFPMTCDQVQVVQGCTAAKQQRQQHRWMHIAADCFSSDLPASFAIEEVSKFHCVR